jgi:hypothetical protein
MLTGKISKFMVDKIEDAYIWAWKKLVLAGFLTIPAFLAISYLLIASLWDIVV